MTKEELTCSFEDTKEVTKRIVLKGKTLWWQKRARHVQGCRYDRLSYSKMLGKIKTDRSRGCQWGALILLISFDLKNK